MASVLASEHIQIEWNGLVETGIDIPLMSDDELWMNVGELSIDGNDILVLFSPCVPRYFPDPEDKDLQRIGGQKLYILYCRPGSHNHCPQLPSSSGYPFSHMSSGSVLYAPLPTPPRRSYSIATAHEPQLSSSGDARPHPAASKSSSSSAQIESQQQSQALSSAKFRPFSRTKSMPSPKKGGLQYFGVVNTTKGMTSVFTSLNQAQSRLETLTSRGFEGYLKAGSELQNTIEGSDSEGQEDED
ncbi:hypothetical protein EV421DRAFT_1732642 [Armillaria borealis]|uniref:Uncharacterized protein n=1 Tax=Armillaria borealis TaxID=47425 RepID=A0AA39MWN4_9AGAR|nr:hypothetical protein EV421DRAFT_1732642 [Armillaria borealis]